jgi:hypothetical protein
LTHQGATPQRNSAASPTHHDITLLKCACRICALSYTDKRANSMEGRSRAALKSTTTIHATRDK